LVLLGVVLTLVAESTSSDFGRWHPVLWVVLVVVGGGSGALVAVRRHRAELERDEAVVRLTASETRFRTLAENATDVVFLADADRRVTWVSANVERVLGWAPADLVGTIVADLMHPDDAPGTAAARDRLYAGEDALPLGGFTQRMRTKSGSYRWMAGGGRPVMLPGEKFIGVVAGFRDVTDVVLAGHRLRRLLDSMLEPFVQLTAVRDESGTIVDFEFTDSNPAAQAVYRMTREQLLGSRLLALHPAAGTTDLFAMYVAVVEEDRPMVLDDWAYPQDIFDGRVRRYDVRAVKVGDSVSQVWRDVTERAATAQRLEESEELYRLLAHNSSDVVLLARDGVTLWVSPALTDMLGWTPEEWMSRPFNDFLHPDDLEFARGRSAEIAAGRSRVSRLRLRHRDGDHRWVEVHGAPYVDQHGTITGIVGSFRTVDREVEMEQVLRERARRDALTGLFNRAEALQRLQASMGRPPRTGLHRAVAFCDIDDFKSVNDTHGHAAGDEVLRVIAERIGSAVRGDDLVARLGGDELLVVLEGVHDLADAVAVAEKLSERVRLPIPVWGDTLRVTLSVGLTLVEAGEAVDALIARADGAMYEAKRTGKDRVVAVDARG
jgi:diguanylate cyclase (GGDEF)-like protein/PAS domain S-box-containing protein